MVKLEEIINKPMSAITALITELILFFVAYWFFDEGKTVEMMLVLVVIELRHFRYIWHKQSEI